VIAVDAAAFASSLGAIDFQTSSEATLHMEDTSPAQIGTVGTPNVIAAPTRSLFQTASIGMRSLLDVDWTLRRSGAVAFISGVTW
jgi:hypothetical protein